MLVNIYQTTRRFIPEDAPLLSTCVTTEAETLIRDSLVVPSQARPLPSNSVPDTVISNTECGDTDSRFLVVQILSQCRCWTPSSAATTMSKVQYFMYPVCVLGRTASCSPGFLFLTGTTSYLLGLHPVFLASWQTLRPVCLIVYS
jgi:hypothetical protein